MVFLQIYSWHYSTILNGQKRFVFYQCMYLKQITNTKNWKKLLQRAMYLLNFGVSKYKWNTLLQGDGLPSNTSTSIQTFKESDIRTGKLQGTLQNVSFQIWKKR